MTTATRLTADDLLAMPDEGRGYDLIDGELRENNVSQESSFIAGTIHSILDAFVKPRQLGILFPADAGFQCFNENPDRVRRPDGAFVMRHRLTREQYHARGYCRVVPDLVIEVVSPNDGSDDIHDKREEWLEAGARVFWLVEPRDETIRVYHSDGSKKLFTGTDSITDESIMPGFSCLVAEFFKPPALAD